MAEVVLQSDTKASEFRHLTPIDLEINAGIIELVYLACLAKEYKITGKFYLFEYASEITSLHYENPLDIFVVLKNGS